MLASVKDLGEDLSTLSVTTITGDMEFFINQQATGLNVKDLVKNIAKKNTTESSKLKIVAHTHIDIDHDTVNFIKEGLNIQESGMFLLHQNAILAAQKARHAFLLFLEESVNG